MIFCAPIYRGTVMGVFVADFVFDFTLDYHCIRCGRKFVNHKQYAVPVHYRVHIGCNSCNYVMLKLTMTGNAHPYPEWLIQYT